ncbi:MULTISPECIES: hypothetical protein [Moorena]|uniref:Uncharacterized protein n=1 Tax=Moorena producens (strain JHB) TaxID=1454205 RepID=A0A9Q9SU90_MOOP1|nr:MULTISPECIES: hypothetical protein [Moorena]NEQ12466.1 hypothetical protein [Moorena sp. SIO3E2]NES82274.1 hypothetical protein [Moorena sp. SIO2B7]NEQ10976.1 hypothetical protein [Moorena sp. SIO4E2]NER87097.1 hypothetical protein [Moorena sp. SIO3A2]WAN69750.1 hypothetical protein BJP36_37280 [Moorena producens JHB]
MPTKKRLTVGHAKRVTRSHISPKGFYLNSSPGIGSVSGTDANIASKAMQRGLGGFPHERLHQDTLIICFFSITLH